MNICVDFTYTAIKPIDGSTIIHQKFAHDDKFTNIDNILTTNS